MQYPRVAGWLDQHIMFGQGVALRRSSDPNSTNRVGLFADAKPPATPRSRHSVERNDQRRIAKVLRGNGLRSARNSSDRLGPVASHQWRTLFSPCLGRTLPVSNVCVAAGHTSGRKNARSACLVP